jgi:thioredoxin 1
MSGLCGWFSACKTSFAEIRRKIMSTVEVTKENFEDIVEKNNIVLLDFWASWCGPCRMFGPIFEKVAEKHPEIVFGKVNTEDQQELAGSFQVRSIPTLMVFRQEVLLFEQAGVLPENALEELIGKIKELDMDKIKGEIAQKKTQEKPT